MLAMTSLVSIAAAAASLQIITPVDIVKMSAQGDAFQLWAGDLSQPFNQTPADMLTLQMEVAQNSPDWSVEFDSNFPSLELTSAVSCDMVLDEAAQD